MHCNLFISATPQPITFNFNFNFNFPPNSYYVSSSHQSQLTFNTHLKKSSFTLNLSSGSHSHRFTTNAAAAAVSAPVTESFYELLGIPESVTQNEIKVAYKQMALKYHPDVSPPESKEEHTKKFIRVQEAYETLSDPGTRAEYDCCQRDFTGRRGVRFDERSERWKDRWQSQIMGLKKRSMRTNIKMGQMDSSSMSWGERIRKRRGEAHGSSE